jgi:hypothetical protein
MIQIQSTLTKSIPKEGPRVTSYIMVLVGGTCVVFDGDDVIAGNWE